MRVVFLSVAWLFALIASAHSSAEPHQRSVLVFVQTDARGPFHTEMFEGLRAAIENEAREAVTLYLEYLDRSRFKMPAYQEAVQRHLEEKYRRRPVGVLVGFGAATLEFLGPLRAAIWSDVPMVFGQIDETSFRRLTLQPHTTGHTFRLELSDMVMAARLVVPNLARLAIVGDRPTRNTAFGHFRSQVPKVAQQFEVMDLTSMPVSDLVPRLSNLPDRTAIIYTALHSDGHGTYHPPSDALRLISDKANRPIIVGTETGLGSGAVGGFVVVPEEIGANAARLAMRILDGENADNIPVTRADVVRPIFDWRQLERWRIPEPALPPGSEIRYRPQVAQRNYADFLGYTAAMLLLSVAVAMSFYEHRRRRTAEDTARLRISELALVNRQATAGEMSAAIAHELNQPLGTILNNAEAAELILNSKAPNLEQLKELVADIRRSDRRASEIIRHVRMLMSKTPSKVSVVDLNTTAREAVAVAGIQADANGITLHDALSSNDMPVSGDPIQLQQVVLNLLMNAIEATRDRPPGRRDVVISSYVTDIQYVEVSVSDTGPGIPKENLDRIFQPFFSTKETGMGVGLSLCRTVIEAHNGSIWVANGMAGGAIFRFRLPLANRGTLS